MYVKGWKGEDGDHQEATESWLMNFIIQNYIYYQLIIALLFLFAMRSSNSLGLTVCLVLYILSGLLDGFL